MEYICNILKKLEYFIHLQLHRFVFVTYQLASAWAHLDH